MRKLPIIAPFYEPHGRLAVDHRGWRIVTTPENRWVQLWREDENEGEGAIALTRTLEEAMVAHGLARPHRSGDVMSFHVSEYESEVERLALSVAVIDAVLPAYLVDWNL